jgi:hypothetical protein
MASDPPAPPDDDDAPIDVGLLLSALDGDAPRAPASPQITREVESALAALVSASLIEIDDDRRPALVAELCTVVGEARSPRDYLKRFVRTIVHSDHVEEIYGSDDELREVIAKITSG